MALGLAAAQFLTRDLQLVPGVPATTLASALLVMGGTVLTVMGGFRYVRSRTQIDRGGFRPAVGVIVVATVLAVVVGSLALVLVLLLHTRS